VKKLIITLTCLLMLSGVAVASPQFDFSQGQGALDITWRNSENTVLGTDFSKKYNFDGSLTMGLGNNFALEYRNFVPESHSTFNTTTKVRTNEYNLLYKLDNNVAILAGIVNAKGYLSNPFVTYETNTRNFWQAGVVASTTIAPKTTLWGSVAAGNNITNYEIGVGYALSQSWECNLNYRSLKLTHFDYDVDLEAKGFGLGLTYKY